MYISAAKKRDEALDHVLLYGPPGLGKTTLAMVIANEMQVKIKSTSGPAIEKAGDLVALLSELNPGDVLFIDEIHRLPKNVEEVLYSAMETSTSTRGGQDKPPIQARAAPTIPLIGATTRAGNSPAPLQRSLWISSNTCSFTMNKTCGNVQRTAKVFNTQLDVPRLMNCPAFARHTRCQQSFVENESGFC